MGHVNFKDWLIFTCFTPYRQYSSHDNGDDYQVNDRLWYLEVSLAALTSLLFFEIQRNDLLRAKGVIVI